MLFDCVLGGGFQGSRILPSERLPEMVLPSCSDAHFWCLGLLATGRSRQGAAVQWRLYRCRQRASTSRRTEGQLHRGPNVRPFWWSAHPPPKLLAPTPPKALPSCLEVAAHQNQRAGAAPPLHTFIESSSSGANFCFFTFSFVLMIFLFGCVLDLFSSFCCFSTCVSCSCFFRGGAAGVQICWFFHCLSTSQQTCCSRQSVRFCVGCPIVVPKTLSYVQSRRIGAPLYI